MSKNSIFILPAVFWILILPLCNQAAAESHSDWANYVITEKQKDEELLDLVKKKITGDRDLSPFQSEIYAKSDSGVITLTGTVTKESAKKLFEIKISQLPGVDRVINNIHVQAIPSQVGPTGQDK